MGIKDLNIGYSEQRLIRSGIKLNYPYSSLVNRIMDKTLFNGFYAGIRRGNLYAIIPGFNEM